MFVKIHEQILSSSIMETDVKTRYVWMCLLVLCDSEGFVDMTLPSIARRINLEILDVEKAINQFCSPDPHSRTPNEEGRRLVPIRDTFGWQIVNYAHYRRIRSEEERKEQNRIAQQKQRDKKKSQQASAIVSKRQQNQPIAEAEAEAEAEADTNLSSPLDPVVEIFDYWRLELGHSNCLLSADRKKAIAARLKEGYTPPRVKAAIRGIKNSPHHMGENDRKTVYDDIELICRNGKNVDKFAELDVCKNQNTLSQDGFLGE